MGGGTFNPLELTDGCVDVTRMSRNTQNKKSSTQNFCVASNTELIFHHTQLQILNQGVWCTYQIEYTNKHFSFMYFATNKSIFCPLVPSFSSLLPSVSSLLSSLFFKLFPSSFPHFFFLFFLWLIIIFIIIIKLICFKSLLCLSFLVICLTPHRLYSFPHLFSFVSFISLYFNWPLHIFLSLSLQFTPMKLVHSH